MRRRYLGVMACAVVLSAPTSAAAQAPAGQLPTLAEARCEQYATVMENLCKDWCASGCVSESDPCMPFEWDREARLKQCRAFSSDLSRYADNWQRDLQSRLDTCKQHSPRGPARSCAGPSGPGTGVAAIAAIPSAAMSAMLLCAELQSTHERLLNEAAALRARVAALRNLSALDPARTSLAHTAQWLEASAASASAALATAAASDPRVSTNLSRRMGSLSDSMRSVRRALSSPNPFTARIDAIEVERTAVAHSISGVRERADAGGCTLTTAQRGDDRPVSAAVFGITGANPSIQQDSSGGMTLTTTGDSAFAFALGSDVMAYGTGDMAIAGASGLDVALRGGAVSIASTPGATRSPPTVTTIEARITPRRTAYTVDRDPASSVTLVYVSEGSVEVQALDSGQRVMLPAGQWAAVTPGSIRTSATLPQQPQLADLLGAQWDVMENGLRGVWTRRTGGNTFDAVWPSVGIRAVLEMTLVGTRVSIARRQSSDGNDCDYLGELTPPPPDSGPQVTGTYTCTRFPTPMPWQATVSDAARADPAGTLAVTPPTPPDVWGAPINLALKKRARQSSRSQWSRSDDPQGAVDGVKNGSFGFHTDREANPWWDVDLGDVYMLDRVIVYNRVDYGEEGAHRATPIAVWVSDDGVAFRRVVWNRSGPYGGVTGKPLELAISGTRARFVRVQLNSADYLHLDEVEVLGWIRER